MRTLTINLVVWALAAISVTPANGQGTLCRTESKGRTVVRNVAGGAVAGGYAGGMIGGDRKAMGWGTLAGGGLGAITSIWAKDLPPCDAVYGSRQASAQQGGELSNDNVHNRRIGAATEGDQQPAHPTPQPMAYGQRPGVAVREIQGVNYNTVKPILISGLRHQGYEWVDPQMFRQNNMLADYVMDVTVSMMSSANQWGADQYGIYGMNVQTSRFTGGGTYRVSVDMLNPRNARGVSGGDAMEEITVVMYTQNNANYGFFVYAGQRSSNMYITDPASFAASRALEYIFGLRGSGSQQAQPLRPGATVPIPAEQAPTATTSMTRQDNMPQRQPVVLAAGMQPTMFRPGERPPLERR